MLCGCVVSHQWTIVSCVFQGMKLISTSPRELDPGQQLTHLFILNLESGQPGLQLMVPHKQLCLDGLLCTDLADLQRETLSLELHGARVEAITNIPSGAQDTEPARQSDLPQVTHVGHSQGRSRWELGSS